MLTVSARPYEFVFDPVRTAVVSIDMQYDFIADGGFGAILGNDVDQLKAIVPAVASLLDWARQHGVHIVHTRESHLPDLSDCPPAKLRRGKLSKGIGDSGPMGRILIRGEPGNDILAEVGPQAGDLVIDKPGKGAFYATPLGAHLQEKGITHLIVCGVTTEVCVQTTLREANDRGYECLLIEEATASYFPAFKQAALDMLTAQGGIVCWTAPLDALLSADVVAMTLEA
jgi:nicotinamidase-related amidase